MKLGNTLFLLLLLLGLGGVVGWQLLKEDRGGVDVDLRLFEGVDARNVTTVRVDNIERSLNVRFERDAQGEWYLTDPIVYPAASGVMKLLLEDIAVAKMMVVPEEEWGEKELGFDPPKVVLEVDEKTPEGVKTTRVEVGAKDLDGMRVHVRVDGRYYRCLVRLYTTLNREVHDWRSRRALSLPPLEVVEVHRTGRFIREVDGEPIDYTTQAFLDGDQWRSTVPYAALLDPMDIGILVMGTAALQIDRFVDDAPSNLAEYGLDQPLLRIELATAAGARDALLVSRLGNTSRWFLKREGTPNVWTIEPEKVGRLMYNFEDMLERHFMRATRRDVNALVLTRPEGEIRLELGERSWSVSRRDPGGTWSTPVPASAIGIEDALARLEELEVEGYFVQRPAPEAEWDRAVRVEAGGRTSGGQLGGETLDEEGNTRILFRRDGDEVIGWIDPWLAELAARELDRWRSTDLLILDEVQLSGLSLTRGASQLRYGRDNRGIWRAVGQEEEAVELLTLLDPLIFLRAAEHLGVAGPLDDPITVEFQRFSGDPVRFTVGSGGEGGGSRIAVGPGVSSAKVADLHARLAALFGE